MRKTIYHNGSKRVEYVGGRSIPPGEAREVDERDLPGYRAEAPPPQPAASVLDVLDLSIAQIREHLPDLTDEDLDLIESTEVAGKTRKGVISSITEERLRRASTTAGGE